MGSASMIRFIRCCAKNRLLCDLDSETLNTYLKFENAKRYYTAPAYRAAVNKVIARHSEDFNAD